MTFNSCHPFFDYVHAASLCRAERHERVAAECPAEPRNRTPDRLARDKLAGPCVRPEQRRAMRRHGEAVGVREGGHVLRLFFESKPMAISSAAAGSIPYGCGEGTTAVTGPTKPAKVQGPLVPMR